MLLQFLDLLLELGLILQLASQIIDLLLELGDQSCLSLLARRLLGRLSLQAPANFTVHSSHDLLLYVCLDCADCGLSKSLLPPQSGTARPIAE